MELTNEEIDAKIAELQTMKRTNHYTNDNVEIKFGTKYYLIRNETLFSVEFNHTVEFNDYRVKTAFYDEFYYNELFSTPEKAKQDHINYCKSQLKRAQKMVIDRERQLKEAQALDSSKIIEHTS